MMAVVNDKLTSGQRLTNFSLPDTNGQILSIGSYRRRSNLVVLFSGEPVRSTFTDLLDELADRYDGLDEHEAQAVAVLAVPPAEAAARRDWTGNPFPVLIDAGGNIHREVGAVDDSGRPVFTVAILDRYGDIYESYQVNPHSSPPSVQEMLEWFAYIELQCDE